MTEGKGNNITIKSQKRDLENNDKINNQLQ